MKVIDCIKTVVNLIGDQDMGAVIEKIESGEELVDSDTKILNRYINGLNIAVDTIASRYYQNIKTVRVVSDSEQRIPYEALDERLYEVLEVVGPAGSKVEFYSLPFSVFVPKKLTQYTVKFKYLPKKASQIEDDVEVLPFVSERAIGYLMASDIMLSRNLYDESKFWFNNFDSIMTQAVATRRVRSLAFDKWL